jgi:hypothetical protein
MYEKAHYEVLVEKLGKLRSMSQARAVKYLRTNAKAFLEKKIETSKSDELRLFRKVKNLCKSYADGLVDGSVEVAELRLLQSEVAQAEREFITARVEAAAVKAAKVKANQDDGDTPEWQKLEKKEVEEVYTKYSVWKDDLPSSVKVFTAKKMPILAVTKGFADMAKLKRTGLCEDLLFGYPILLKQILVGANYTWLAENFNAKKHKSRGGIVQSGIDFGLAADYIAAELYEKTRRRFLMLGDPHKLGNIAWMWMASDQDLKLLSGTTGGSQFVVKDWSFPFKNEINKLPSSLRS